MANVIEVNNDKLDADIEEASLAILDFWSETCAPCKVMHPIVEQIADLFKGEIKVASINVDVNPNLTQRFVVRGVPSLIILKRGGPIKKILGAHSLDKLKVLIQNYKQQST